MEGEVLDVPAPGALHNHRHSARCHALVLTCEQALGILPLNDDTPRFFQRILPSNNLVFFDMDDKKGSQP